MKIGFTVDTNMLEGSNAKTTSLSKNLDLYLKYINALSRKDKQNTLKLFLSEIVVKEILNHEKRKIESEYLSLQTKFKDLDFIFDGDLPTNKIDSIFKNERSLIKKLNILKVPTSEEQFKKIIHSALELIPPFIKKKGDAGFKDALIWESILSSIEIDDCDKFYFFTCDKDYLEYKDFFENEFKNYHKNCMIKMIGFENNNNDKRQQALALMIKENQLIETNITKLFDEDFILTFIHELNDIEILLKSKNDKKDKIKIEFSKLNKENIMIRDVLEQKNIYEVLLDVNTYDHDKQSILAPIHANQKLTFEVLDGDFNLISNEVTNIYYVDMAIDNFVQELSEISKNIELLSTKPILKSHYSSLTVDQLNETINNINQFTELFKNVRRNFDNNDIKQFQEIRNQIEKTAPIVHKAKEKIELINKISDIVNSMDDISNQINH